MPTWAWVSLWGHVAAAVTAIVVTAAPPAARAPTTDCASSPASPAAPTDVQMPWAQLRLPVNGAWRRTHGAGVIVAVVSSGVEERVPQLAGRVLRGADVGSHGGPGNHDCSGRGTAMAALIVGRPLGPQRLSGLAPDAKILPVRVAVTDAEVPTSVQALGIEVAASAGASVIAVAGPTRLTDTSIARAVENAVRGGAVVVVGASLEVGSPRREPPGDGVVTVGAVGPDDETVGGYRPGAVAVVAPGKNITSVGVDGSERVMGTGTDFAVALVAGLTALVRSAYPDLSPAALARRVVETAEPLTTTVPDPQFGWGLINPTAAVLAPIIDIESSAPERDPVDRWIDILLVALGCLAVALVVPLHRSTRR
jgi:membrane-anchored mycosin MYCP